MNFRKSTTCWRLFTFPLTALRHSLAAASLQLFMTYESRHLHGTSHVLPIFALLTSNALLRALCACALTQIKQERPSTAKHEAVGVSRRGGKAWGASPSRGVPRCCAYAATQSVHSAWRPVTFTLSGRAFLSSCDIMTLPVKRFLTPWGKYCMRGMNTVDAAVDIGA